MVYIKDKDTNIHEVIVTSVGQITIPKEIREKLNISPTNRMKLSTFGSSIIINKKTNDSILSYTYLHDLISELKEENLNLHSHIESLHEHNRRQDMIIKQLQDKLLKKK